MDVKTIINERYQIYQEKVCLRAHQEGLGGKLDYLEYK